MKLYMAITNDKYELPLYVDNVGARLAEVMGITYKNMLKDIRDGGYSRKCNCKFIRIEVDDD